jgi:ubiquinone/menaquinone biosynthesis C-methylase UbiE
MIHNIHGDQTSYRENGEVAMAIWERIAAQFGKPTGFPGVLAGKIMANRSSNRERIDWAISLLEARPSDRVLEIGFGPGIAIQKLSRIVRQGSVWGIDHSEVMVKEASARNRRAIHEGRVKLLTGSVSEMPFPDIRADRVLDINSFQFWKTPSEDLKKLRAIMAPGGMIALVHQPRKPGSTDSETVKAGKKLEACLEEAGFTDIRLQMKRMKPASTVCVTGRN